MAIHPRNREYYTIPLPASHTTGAQGWGHSVFASVFPAIDRTPAGLEVPSHFSGVVSFQFTHAFVFIGAHARTLGRYIPTLGHTGATHFRRMALESQVW